MQQLFRENDRRSHIIATKTYMWVKTQQQTYNHELCVQIRQVVDARMKTTAGKDWGEQQPEDQRYIPEPANQMGTSGRSSGVHAAVQLAYDPELAISMAEGSGLVRR